MQVLKNPRHERFAQGVVQGLSADAAYRAAGYKPSRAHAARLAANGNVRARIKELQTRAAIRAEIDGARILKEYEAIALARVTDYMTIGSDGLPVIDFSHMTEDQKAALAEIQVDMLDIERDGKRGQRK